jgi:hypothetical protein
MAKEKAKKNQKMGQPETTPDPNHPKIPFYDLTLFTVVGFEWIFFVIGFIFFGANGA